MVTDLLEAMPVYLGTATETMTGKWTVSLIKGGVLLQNQNI